MQIRSGDSERLATALLAIFRALDPLTAAEGGDVIHAVVAVYMPKTRKPRARRKASSSSIG